MRDLRITVNGQPSRFPHIALPEIKGARLERSEFPPIRLTVVEGVVVSLIVLAVAFTLTGLWGLTGGVV